MKKITKNLLLLPFFWISLFVSSDKVDFSVSEKYQGLSSEIFKNISSHHYIREVNEESFNDLYIDALLEELDGNKNLFLSYEISFFLNAISMKRTTPIFSRVQSLCRSVCCCREGLLRRGFRRRPRKRSIKSRKVERGVIAEVCRNSFRSI